MKTIYTEQDYKTHIGNLIYRCTSAGELIDPYNPKNYDDPSFLSPAERDLYEAYLDQPTYAYVATRDGMAYMILAIEYGGEYLHELLSDEVDCSVRNIPEDWQKWMIDFFTNLAVLFEPEAECYLDFWAMSSSDMINKAEFLLLIPYKNRGKIHEWANLMKVADESFGGKFTDKFGKPKFTLPKETRIFVPYATWNFIPDFSRLVTFENREQAEWYQENILNDQFEEGLADLPEEIFEDEKFPKTVLCIGIDESCGTYLIDENAILSVAKFLSELTNCL